MVPSFWKYARQTGDISIGVTPNARASLMNLLRYALQVVLGSVPRMSVSVSLPSARSLAFCTQTSSPLHFSSLWANWMMRQSPALICCLTDGQRFSVSQNVRVEAPDLPRLFTSTESVLKNACRYMPHPRFGVAAGLYSLIVLSPMVCTFRLAAKAGIRNRVQRTIIAFFFIGFVFCVAKVQFFFEICKYFYLFCLSELVLLVELRNNHAIITQYTHSAAIVFSQSKEVFAGRKKIPSALGRRYLLIITQKCITTGYPY